MIGEPLGKFLFKYRSFTPIPVILGMFVLVTPSPFPQGTKPIVILGSLLAIMAGEGLRVASVGFSFRGTSGRESYLRADQLNTTGLYSIVRNPLYIGNLLIFSGLAILFWNPLALIVINLFLCLQYYFIIRTEERFLESRYGDVFLDYTHRVNRIIPSWKNFIPPRHPFDLRKVIAKENDSIFNFLFMALVILGYREYHFTGHFPKSSIMYLFLFILTGLYIFVKVLKKTGRLN